MPFFFDFGSGKSSFSSSLLATLCREGKADSGLQSEFVFLCMRASPIHQHRDLLHTLAINLTLITTRHHPTLFPPERTKHQPLPLTQPGDSHYLPQILTPQTEHSTHRCSTPAAAELPPSAALSEAFFFDSASPLFFACTMQPMISLHIHTHIHLHKCTHIYYIIYVCMCAYATSH